MSIHPIALARNRARLSQSGFAAALGVSLRTIQEWEQGRRKPSAAARALLNIAELSPAALRKMAAQSGRRGSGSKPKRSDEPLAGLQPIHGRIRELDKSTAPHSSVKVMLVVARKTVLFFKQHAAKHSAQYQ